MPFPAHTRRRYTSSHISRMLPRQQGVFGIHNEQRWLYIGYSHDIRASLMDLWKKNDRLDAMYPTGWAYELTNVPQIRAVLLIAELRPVINIRDRAWSRMNRPVQPVGYGGERREAGQPRCNWEVILSGREQARRSAGRAVFNPQGFPEAETHQTLMFSS